MASGSGSSGSWSFEHMKIVERALIEFPEDVPGRWEKIATRVGGGKTVEDVKKYYTDLIEDVANIEAGRVELPAYKDDESQETTETVTDDLGSTGANYKSESEESEKAELRNE